MEIKKSQAADLENKRLTGFLMGLVLALALMFVAFEYTTRDKKLKSADQTLDDMSQDLEMMPAMEQKDMVAAALPASSSTVTENLNETDDHSDLKEVNNANDGNLSNDASNGAAGNGTATDAGAVNKDNETTALSPVPVDKNDNPLNFRVVEELPDFPGGMVEFMKWLTKNLKYPVIAKQQNIQGKVTVSFIVNKDGTTADAKIVKGVNPYLDNEALRVVRMMPKWKPGTQKGKACRTLICIPVVFKI